MKKLILLAICIAPFANYAQEKEKGFIKEMCGCYQVDFEYAETFSETKDYEYHDRYSAHGLEWIFVDYEDSNTVVLQHLLVINDTTIIKHWRQDWHYENNQLLEYKKNLEWSKEKLPINKTNGTWTQKVYQVDDSPRYEGAAHWVNLDGKTYWESQTYAPLPRREYTKRSDYNVMLRNNKHKITEYGHVHELDNAKIIRSENGEEILVWEKGMNSYTKVDASKCNPAKMWWTENSLYWQEVRAVWTNIIDENEYINITKKVDGKKLWQELFALGDEYTGVESINSKQLRIKIRKTIEKFISNKPSEWADASNAETKSKY